MIVGKQIPVFETLSVVLLEFRTAQIMENGLIRFKYID